MYRKWTRIWVLMSTCFILSVCSGGTSPSTPYIPTPTFTKNHPTEMITTSPTIVITTPTKEITPVSTSTPDITPTITPANQSQCPIQLTSNEQPLLKNGSLLFTFGGPGAPVGIWAISSANSKPFFITQSPAGSPPIDTVLSPDKNKLAWQDALADPNRLIIYNLETLKQKSFLAKLNWRIIEEWMKDGRIKILTDVKEEARTGLAYSYDLFDPVSQKVDELSEEFSLLNFQFDDIKYWNGFASINPDRTKVFYTAKTAIMNGKTDFVLLDVADNFEIWRYPTDTFQGEIPIGRWSADGQKIAFGTNGWPNSPSRIYSLDINNLQLNELAVSEDTVRQLDWSPDGRYLLYSKFLLDWNKGPGFIIDTQTGYQKEICEEGYVFGNEAWIENTDLLLYTMYSEEKTKVELLDTSSWETQKVIELGPNNWINLIGWTPIELP